MLSILVVANEELGHMMQWQVHEHESQRSCGELQSPKYGCGCKTALQQSSTENLHKHEVMNF